MKQRCVFLFVAALFVSPCFFCTVAVAGPRVVVSAIDSEGIRQMVRSNKGAMVIVAMAAWCLPCRQELPTLVKLNSKYATKGLKMIGLSVDLNGPSAMQPLLDKARVNFPVYWAGEKTVRDFNIAAIPMMFLIKDDSVIEKIQGRQSEEFLDQKITELLK